MQKTPTAFDDPISDFCNRHYVGMSGVDVFAKGCGVGLNLPLARLVPPELQTAYYRVLAHTHTLGPDDEMLCILEAMGILALVTRHTPKDIADERERIQEMLDLHLQFSDESQQKMLKYVHFIEGRLSSCLPRLRWPLILSRLPRF